MSAPLAPGGRAAQLRPIVDALNAGDAASAFTGCATLLSHTPDDAALNQLAATAALRSGRMEDASRLARRSLAARPGHGATLVLLGRAARALGSYEEASQAFAQAATREPGGAEPAFLLRLVEIEAGRSVASLSLDDLARRFPGDAIRWGEMADALLRRGETVAALFGLTVAFRAAPEFDLAMRRALLARDLGLREETRRALADALTLRPDSARAWLLSGIAAQDGHDDDAAQAAYRRALVLDPGLAEAAVNLGTLLQERRDLAGAKQAYAQGLRARPGSFGRVAQALATSPRGELWLDLGRLRRSLGG